MINPYQPKPVRIVEIKNETEDKSLKTFKLKFIDSADGEGFSYLPGQFAEISVAGQGEIPIGIASSPTEKAFLKFTIMNTGKVTSCLHRMRPREVLGIRGPLGNGFPWDRMRGKTIVMIGGGFGFTTLRSSIRYMLTPENRPDFNGIHVVYGARTPGMLLYLDELIRWSDGNDINMHLVAQEAGDGWRFHIGLAPTVAHRNIPHGTPQTIALVCGPPAMIKFTQPVLDELGYTPDNIYLSLEMRMKCGIGMCGRCNVGDKFVCQDGPVFSMAALRRMPREY